MTESGALGARLTGAGFGGFAIALVHEKNIKKLVDKICELYYNKYIEKKHPDLLRNLTIDNRIVFAVKSSQRAEVKVL